MQVRIKLPSLNPFVQNKVLIVDSRRFKRYFNLFFEKRFTKGSKKIVEYYHNGDLETYTEKEEIPNFIITRGYDSKGILFNTVVEYLKKNGKPFMVYENIDQEPGFYRRIYSKGQYSREAFDSLEECLYYWGEKIY